MYIQFDFFDGSNPYVAFTTEETFRMFCKYYTAQAEKNMFVVCGSREWNGKPSYEGKKDVARAIAQDWQGNFEKFSYSWADVIAWEEFFETIGKKFGLLHEFRENAII